MGANHEIIIKEISMDNDFIYIFFDINSVQEMQIEGWIESKNKYNPNILNIIINNNQHCIVINRKDLCDFIQLFPKEWFKISLCDSTRRIKYKISNSLDDIFTDNYSIFRIEDSLFFIHNLAIQKNNLPKDDVANFQHTNKPRLNNFHSLPIKTLSIGSCFSRSIFKSDNYFNPTYKKFFHIEKTLFHNSLISLFSDTLDCDISKIEDLTSGDAALYVNIEFLKNIEDIFANNNFKLIVVDNYIDATSPVIKYGDNSFLTYNRYLAESILKRKISSYDIIYPGTKQHLELYRKSVIIFRNMIEKYNIKDIVLIGSRLSKYKIDEKNNYIDIWSDKMEWILTSNQNWDKVDKIFLEEIPNSIYIDKRSTNWKSDINSPILGGASPSHYQSMYYKELFSNITSYLCEVLIDEKRDN